MDLRQIVETYGYLAVFVGAFLEGETILILAGFAARLGYLQLHWVILLAIIAGTLGDQLYFYLGRRYGDRMLRRSRSIQVRARKFGRLLRRYQTPLVLVIRFLYGLRIVGPIVIGMSRVHPAKFVVLNVAGAVIWAIVVAGAGYLFGSALELLLKDIKRYEGLALAALVALSMLAWAAYSYRSRKSRNGQK